MFSAAPEFGERAAAVARRASVDAVAAELLGALEAAGLRALLLKGPVIESWLYPPGERDYHDVDVMVASGDLARAHGILTGAGFFPVAVGDRALQHAPDRAAGIFDELGAHAVSYRRTDGLPGWVDLHRALWRTPPSAWELLSARTDRLIVGGRSVEAPALPARALIVALHALHHHVSGAHMNPAGKALEDLRRAVAHAEEAVWQEAARMAASVGAELQLADALRLVAGGEQLASALGLATGAAAADAALAERILLLSRYERLTHAEGWRARFRLAARALFPSRALVHAQDPRARRGNIGLAMSYGARGWVVVRRAPSGLRTWQRARAVLAATERSKP